MNLHELDIYIWQRNLLEKELEAMNNAIQYFFTNKNSRIIGKINGYQKVTAKIMNFSTLSPAIFESSEDFNELICLLLGGHYKSCLLLLRTHFELMNGIIRAIKNNQPQKNFYNTREIKTERKFLTKSLEISEDWKNELIELFDNLSKFTHASGKKNSNKQFTPFPQPMFVKESFDFCLNLINQVIEHNAGLLKICFKSEYWDQDLLKNIYGKNFNNKNIYQEESIKYLYKNIDNALINKYLK